MNNKNQNEPVAVVTGVYGGRFTYAPIKASVILPVGTALYTHPQSRKPLTDERLELIGHADLAINNIHIFNGYGEDVPEGRTPIYAGYKTAHDIKD